jgi:hypothetical protein
MVEKEEVENPSRKVRREVKVHVVRNLEKVESK